MIAKLLEFHSQWKDINPAYRPSFMGGRLMSSLQGKVAVVTGASYGVGRAIAIGLAREGCDVVLAATSEDKLKETLERVIETGRRGVVCSTDISQIDQVQNLARTVEK